MNSVHDFGGMQCYGPVIHDNGGEPTFRHDWERRTFAIHLLVQLEGMMCGDECRHEMEKMNPVHYLESAYYEHWMHATEMLLLSKGILTQQELDSRTQALKFQEATDAAYA
jgi:nitrile hydratase